MIEIAQIVGAFTILLLIASAALWGSLRRPAFRPPIKRAQTSKGSVERYAQLATAAISLSALAASLLAVMALTSD